jgi:hypothetical protein
VCCRADAADAAGDKTAACRSRPHRSPTVTRKMFPFVSWNTSLVTLSLRANETAATSRG